MPIPAFRPDGWLPEGHHPAAWDEVVATFGGSGEGRRAALTRALLDLRDALAALGVTGSLLLDGSYISDKPEPGDFDVLLIGPPDIQSRKDTEPALSDLLDAERAERERGCSLYFAPEDSPVLEILRTLWDETKRGVAKGCVEVRL